MSKRACLCMCNAKCSQTHCACRYGYYFASSAGMRVSQSVKKCITLFQLVQVARGLALPNACLLFV